MTDTPMTDSPKSLNEIMAAQSRQRRIFLVVVEEGRDADIALQYACLRAKDTNARVALVAVMEKTDLQQWGGIEEIMRAEKRQEAEQLLLRKSKFVMEQTKSYAICYIREGDKADEIFKLVDSDPSFSVLVLGADTDPKGPGPITTRLLSKGFGNIRIPITIVPANLTDEEIVRLT